MTDILNRDEMDRLLNVTGFDAPPGSPEMSPPELEAAERLVRVFFASANSVMETLLARPATVTAGPVQVAPVADSDTTDSVLLQFPLHSGFGGTLNFLLYRSSAAVLADLLLGGEGTPEEGWEESDLDTLKEAITQVANNSAPVLSTTLGTEIGFDPPEIKLVERHSLADGMGISEAFQGTGRIQVEDLLDAPLRILLAVPLAQEMARVELEGQAIRASTGTLSSTHAQPRAGGPDSPPGDSETLPPEPSPDIRNINLIMDIEVEVMVRLGEAEMTLREIQQLRPGSVINLDKDTNALVELVVNNRVIAKGELVLIGSEHFALRITEIETPSERIRTLGP